MRVFLKQQQFETLFGVVLSLDAANPYIIGSLGHDLAVDILYRKLCTRAHRPFEKLEIAENQGNDGGRALKLCCMLVTNNSLPTLKGLFVEKLDSYNDEWIQIFIRALESNACLEGPNLRASRYIHSWFKGRMTIRQDEEEDDTRLSFAPHVLSMCAKTNNALSKLVLSSNPMTKISPSTLADEIPPLKLKSLLLRDTELGEASLLEVARSLKDDKILQELDLSRNKFTLKITEVLCVSLKEFSSG